MNRMIENRSSYISNKMNMSKKKIDFYFFALFMCPVFTLFSRPMILASIWLTLEREKIWKRVKVENFLIASLMQ